MRVLLFAGKGGVGKTTMAAATAVRAARAGVKTLVLSADPAHSLGDCLVADLSGGRPVEVESGLAALQLDPRVRPAPGWQIVQGFLERVLDAAGLDPIEAAELLALSGADDLSSLLAVSDRVHEGSWDLVLVDAAPTAETVRLLSLPESLLRVVSRTLPRDRLVARAVGPILGPALPRPTPQVEAALVGLRHDLRAVVEVLKAPSTSARLVLTPEAVVLAEARRLLTALSVHGYTVDGVLANRVVPPEGEDPWRNGWARAQGAVLDQADADFAPVPVQRVPYQATEPIGVEALAGLAEAVLAPRARAGADDLLALPELRAVVQVRSVSGGFDLLLPAPLTRAADVEMSRDGDDLRVRVGMARRVVHLPSVLRRCVARGARVAEGQIRIRFEPDPALWPDRSGMSP